MKKHESKVINIRVALTRKPMPVELIEVKRKLKRLVIGQTIAGHDMFKKDYHSGKITDLILCSEGDPALEWVCKKRKISVKVIPI